MVDFQGRAYIYFTKASDLLESGQPARAARYFRLAAALKDFHSEQCLGVLYDTGEGVARSREKALYWYKRAWSHGRQSSICSNIASVYAEVGNRRRAEHWWRRALEMGDGDAAVDYAEYLASVLLSKYDPKISFLLNRALQSERISQLGRERATEMLACFK